MIELKKVRKTTPASEEGGRTRSINDGFPTKIPEKTKTFVAIYQDGSILELDGHPFLIKMKAIELADSDEIIEEV